MNLRNLLFASILTVFTVSVYAAPVDPARAINVAEQFMPAKQFAVVPGKAQAPAQQQTPEIVYTHFMPKSGKPAIYAININGGFALVSADDVAHPVLGYNYGKPWPTDVDSLAPSIKGFLDDLAAQMEAASEHPQDSETAAEWQEPRNTPNHSPRRTPAESSLPDSVGPLLTTTWDQGQYYNALCPEDPNGPDGHALTGCVATAMAQIIKYWGYPIHGHGAHAYNPSNLDPNSMCPLTNIEGYGTQFVDFSQATYDYAHMPEALTNESSQAEIDAVSKLMYHCGVAVNMFFGEEASGAYSEDVRAALISYFGFAPFLGYADRQLYSDQAWEDSLRANIDRGEPIYYTGSNIFNSHAFVCDGYKQDGYFHFNFGWSGSADGWFLTKAINVDFGYSEWQAAIMGIRPDSATHAIICHKTMHVENRDSFIVTKPVDLYPLRGASEYLAINEMKGVRTNLTLSPKDSLNQLVLDILAFDKEQSIVIYDGVNKDSILRVLETRYYDEWNRITNVKNNWTYDALPSDSIYNQLASMDFSPIISTRHGLTIVAYSYGGYHEGFHLRVRNVSDTPPTNPETNTGVYWKDIVTTEPNDFMLDGDTIRVSSKEGLAWVARYVDSLWLAGVDDGFDYKVLSIESDIDLSEHLWEPIRVWYGNINGNGHVIKNMKVSTQESGGLFSRLIYAKVSDMGIFGAQVNAVGNPAAIAGVAHNCVIENCYSVQHHLSSGNSVGGGLVGYAIEGTQIFNCYAYGNIYSQFGFGGIVGYVANSEINNCVSQLGGEFIWPYRIAPPEWRGLLSEEVHSGAFSNCFADVSKSLGPNVILASNLAYLFLGNIYNADAIDNLSTFNIAEDTLGTLQKDTSVNYTLGDNMDVITALNNKVAEYNSPNYRIWVRDSITHMPVFGDFYEVTCPNVNNISTSNVPHNGDFAVALAWQENGEASEWQIKYNIKNAPESDATIYLANSTQDTITGLVLGNEYSFYIRPICGGGDTVGWGQPFNFYVDKTLWIDMVNNCPEGYVEKNNNVYISSPEALVWVAKTWWYRSDTIFIMNDLNMGAYRWTPNALKDGFAGTFEGNNHTISNLYCSENILDNDAEPVGLTGRVNNASFNNIIIKNGTFRGNHYVGCLFGLAWNSAVNNCHAIDVDVTGLYIVGGLGGGLWSDGGVCKTYNSSATGYINGDQSAGGLYASKSGELINCYSHCNVQPLGIRNERSYEGRGGLLGVSGGITTNCYSTSIVGAHNNDYENVVGSAAGIFGNGELRNVYAQTLDNIPFVGGLEDNYLFADTSSLINTTLQTSITIAETEYTDLLSALNAWVDANNEDGKYRRWAADTENINGGFPIFYTAPKYEITFKNEDGTILQTSTLEEGEMPVAPEVPAKTSTARYTYTFAGWDHAIAPATGNDTYIAVFTPQLRSYTITFLDEDGTVLESSVWDHGCLPSLTTEPTKAATAQYTYTFAGWDRMIAIVTCDTSYTATYTATVNKYLITFANEDGTTIVSQEYDYGSMPVAPTDPIKEATAQYTYTFAGWDNEIVAVTGDATYTATYTATVNKYLITFLNDDESILCAEEWEYGATPSCDDPTKEADGQYAYSFAGWQPEIVTVKGIATYTATYNALSNPTALPTNEQPTSPVKVIENGNIFILRYDKTYTVQGQEVR